MKVLYIHQHFSTPAGATGLRSYRMAKKLVERGHDVTIVCGRYSVGDSGLKTPFERGKRQGVVDGINVIEFDIAYANADSFPTRIIKFARYALNGIRIAVTHRYDVIFCTSAPLTAAIPGIFARWLRFKPFVFEARDLWPELPKEMGVITNPVLLAAMYSLEFLAYRSAVRCIGLSPGIVRGIQRLGVDASKTHMLPNGADLELFGSAGGEPWRPEGVADTDFMAVFTGTHGVANGLDAVLDTAAIVKLRQGNHVKFVFIGEGKLKPALMARAESEGLSNCFFLPSVDKRKLAGLLQSADVGLMILANVPAFYYGTSPNKFFDYLAAGLPVLNNYPGWLADMIEASKCGLTVPPDHPEKMAEALIDLSQMPSSELRSMSDSGRRLAASEFDWNLLSERFAEIFESLTAEKERVQQ